MQYVTNWLSYQVMYNSVAHKSDFSWLYQATTIGAFIVVVSLYSAEHIIPFAIAAG
jgi:hypothetical protein